MEDHPDQPPPDTPTQKTDDIPKVDNAKLYQQIDQFISSSTDNDQSDSSPTRDIIESVLSLVDVINDMIVEYESGSKRLIQLQEDEMSCFIESVDRTTNLVKCFNKFHSEQIYGDVINRLSGIHHRVMSVLEVEFKSIMDDFQTSYDRDHKNVQPLETESKSQEESESKEQSESQVEKDEFLGYSDEMLSNLNKLAGRLIVGGHETECRELYFFVRRNAIEENMKKLGFENYSIDEMQKMQWEPIEKEVCSWKNMFKLYCTSYLPNERKLVDVIFSSYKAISDCQFSSLTRVVLMHLMSFAEAVMLTKRSAEKLFKFLDVYETLRDNISTVEKVISNEWMNELKTSASLICATLGESVFTIFVELENSIKSDATKTPVPSGAVHPLTRYTMNYLKYACEYSDTLEQIFREHKKIDQADSPTGPDDDPSLKENSQEQAHSQSNDTSPFQSQLTKIMDLLAANLEAKSKLYKDPSLSLIFSMNNGRYILQKTKGTGEMRSLLGDPWVRKQSSDLRSYHTSYKRETWTKLLQSLSHEGLSVNGKVMKPVLKERFKSFNSMFDDIYRSQTTWIVSDEQLRSELRVSISAIVIPAYRSFMGRFSQVFTPGRQTEKYIKYQPEDIETCIEELFDGSAAQQSKKR